MDAEDFAQALGAHTIIEDNVPKQSGSVIDMLGAAHWFDCRQQQLKAATTDAHAPVRPS